MTRIKPIVLTAGATVMASGAALVRAVAGLRSGVLTTEVPPLPLAPPEKSSHPIIHRLSSFDVSADHRISRHELPERMQGLVARGDRNADAALDPQEVRVLVNAAPPERRVSFSAQQFEGLPGVIKDLKLTPIQHAAALAIVSRHKVAGSKRDAEMRAVLDDEEYGNFVAAAARLSRRPQINE